MKEQKDSRALECEIIGSKIKYVEEIIKEESGLIDSMPMRDKIKCYQDYVLGAYDIASIFEELINSCNRSIGIAICALRDLDRIRRDNPGLAFRSYIRSKDPDSDLAKAAMVLTEFTPAVVERIVYAIYNTKELFDRETMDMRLHDAYNARLDD